MFTYELLLCFFMPFVKMWSIKELNLVLHTVQASASLDRNDVYSCIILASRNTKICNRCGFLSNLSHKQIVKIGN